MNLDSLFKRYKLLQNCGKTTEDKAKRGFAFEKLLLDLFRLQGILMSKPFRAVGEQIDGAFEYKGWTYIVEAKWQGKKTSTDDLSALQRKSDRRIEGTRGLFISVSGFTKNAVEGIASGRKPNTLLWTGEHIEAVLKGLKTIPELLDHSIRFAAERGGFLIPLDVLLTSEDESLFEAMLQACAAQVDEELSTVGKKFIPKLYIKREVQEQFEQLIHPERHNQHLLSELRKYKHLIYPERHNQHLSSESELRESERVNHSERHSQRPLSKSEEWQYKFDRIDKLLAVGKNRSVFMELMNIARSHLKTFIPPDDIFRVLLSTLPRELNGRLHILTARAGTGKTNLLCHLAEYYVRKQPTIFLTGRSGITEKTSIKDLIESKLSQFSTFPIGGKLNFDQMIKVIEREDTSLLIFFDAMNEHRDLDFLNIAIARFLKEIRGKPVIIIASCRDVYWSFFDTSVWPTSQWTKLDLGIDIYSSAEFERALKAYFDFFNIDASLSKDAKDKLTHPLILRFFCEAYGDSLSHSRIKLHEISDIRLKVLFDVYWKKKLKSIRLTAPRRRRTSQEVENFLFYLAERMCRTKYRAVNRDYIPKVTKQADLESPESVYVAILGEDIILEEVPDLDNNAINVVFTYDEFMEYMIAKSMLRACHSFSETSLKGLVSECEKGVKDFPSFLGVIEYLEVILKEDYNIDIVNYIDLKIPQIVIAECRAITKLGVQYVGEQELRFLGKVTHLSECELRRHAVNCLTQIVTERGYKKRWRARAVDLLKDVLMREDDYRIRKDVVKCFKIYDFTSLSEVAKNIALWWEKKKEETKNKPIVWKEDVKGIRKTIEDNFTEMGYENIFFTSDPVHAIRLVEQVKPVLIITDSPRNGEEIARFINAKPSLTQVPIIYWNAWGGMSSVFSEVFPKSENIKTILPSIQVICVGKFG